MGRILAIDYGKKRCGLAVTDPYKMIATALSSVETKQLFQFIETYIKKEQVETIVIGEPKHKDGMPADIMKDIVHFAGKLRNLFPLIPVQFMDERYTSKIATQTMIMAGYKKKDRMKKDNIDRISAVLILQSFLESIKR
ncbi:MAG TPA: Holliday junction resolvase RuvX [Bacteroidia bacterium]|nr:Holliday junction resolvase RuvX [Bacteroidia bacterium]HNT79153.1 Holliday junction resolvase RuvX [Bacteroidia bacterium]